MMLGRKLEPEFPGILHKLIDHAKRFYANNGRLPTKPKAVDTLTKEFEKIVSPFEDYAEEQLELHHKGRMLSRRLLEHYMAWHADSIGGKFTMTPRSLAQEMRRVFKIDVTTLRDDEEGQLGKGYPGVKFKTDGDKKPARKEVKF
jgi:hypothetical protein